MTYDVGLSRVGPVHRIERTIRVDADGRLAAQLAAAEVWRAQGNLGKVFTVEVRQVRS